MPSCRLPIVRACAFAVALASGSPSSVQGQTEDKRVVAQPRGDEPITIDGRLDEPVWAEAEVATGFVERSPVPGAEPPVGTEVRILYDHEALYVGVVCHHAPGDAIQSYVRTRDTTRLYTDDSVSLKFDPRHDHRTTVGFAINTLDAQLDFYAVENGKVVRHEYDAVWESATTVEGDRWIGEARIPSAALGLPPVEGERVIGFNVTRAHNARPARYDWSHLPPEFSPWSALHYGEIHGVRDIAVGSPYSFEPYALVGYPEGVGSLTPDVRFKAGGDARLRLADATWAELTVLTDFAQVDADDQVLNFDRFPLFFPEQRPFFLSGLEVFEFGVPRTAQLFFSRRIGLDRERREVPILAGVKLYGQSGMFDYGLLDVMTDETLRLETVVDDMGTVDPGDDVESEELVGAPVANWAVGRVRANVGEPGHVGLLVASRSFVELPSRQTRDPFRVAPHVSLGVDGLTRFGSRRLEASGFAALAKTFDGESEDGGSGRLAVRYQGEVFQPSYSALYVSDEFEPALGFVRRTGVLDNTLSAPLVWRTQELGLRSISVIPSLRYEHDEDLLRRDVAGSGLLGRRMGLTLTVDWSSEWSLGGGVHHVVDIVEEDFVLLSELAIAAGRYEGTETTVTLATPASRNPSATATYTFDDAFFGGHRHLASLSSELSLGALFRLTAAGTLSFLVLPSQPRRRTLTVNSGIGFTPSTSLSSDLTLQVSSTRGFFDIEADDDEAVILARTRWRYLPGSDIFLVYQLGIGYDERRQTTVRDHQFVLKATYRFDDVL